MAAKKKKSSALPKGAKKVTLSKKGYYCYSKRVATRKAGKMTSRGFCRAASKVAAKRKAKKK